MRTAVLPLPIMRDEYPYTELEVFIAGYERGRRFARSTALGTLEAWMTEERATRRPSLHDLTREGLAMAGMRADFVPRDVFDAGVRRAFDEATS